MQRESASPYPFVLCANGEESNFRLLQHDAGPYTNRF